MKAVILAGGFGTRIQPLTTTLPKPMLPILNKPMMEHIVHKLKNVGITEIVVLLYFKPEIIKDHFKDGKDFGVNINYITPDDDYGTAGAVRLAAKHLDEPFIIISGDLVSDFDLQKIIDFHKEKNSQLTITLTSVEDPLQFGVVIADEDQKITKFLEKPSWGEVFSDTINTGIYILEPNILDYIPYEENFDFAKDLFPLLMKKGITLWGYTALGYWRDVGNPQSYREVYDDIFKKKAKMEFEGETKEFPHGIAYFQNGTFLPPTLEVEGIVVFGKNITLGEDIYLKNCSIGNNVSIDSKVKISDSIIWDDVKIESKASLNNSLICDNVYIGKKAKAKNGVIISEQCEIQKGVIFEKDVTVWPDKVVEEFSIVNQNIVWGNKYKNSIFENGSVFGITNIELSCQMAIKIAESYGSTLGVGSTVFIARDYHRSSRMIKRAFLGGLLSSGVNAIDLRQQSANVIRHALQNDPTLKGGIQIRKSERGESGTEIVFFDEDGILIDTNYSKSIERIFFRENFRRVSVKDIGEILEDGYLSEQYVKKVFEKIDSDYFRTKDIKIAADLTFGLTGDLYSKIFNRLGVESIILNSYQNEQKLAKAITVAKKTVQDLSKIVANLSLDAGFVIYPNGQRMDLVCDQGNIFSKLQSLIAVLKLLDGQGEKLKVLLPSFSPDFFDDSFKNLKISRRTFSSIKSKTIKEFDFVAGLEGDFTFTDFSLSPDAVYSSIKIIEMLQKQNKKLSDLFEGFDAQYFGSKSIPCESRFKGKLMRKFLEYAFDKKFSHEDGVKIYNSKDEWVHMIPSQNDDSIFLYTQAQNKDRALELEEEYEEKIKRWIVE